MVTILPYVVAISTRIITATIPVAAISIDGAGAGSAVVIIFRRVAILLSIPLIRCWLIFFNPFMISAERASLFFTSILAVIFKDWTWGTLRRGADEIRKILRSWGDEFSKIVK